MAAGINSTNLLSHWMNGEHTRTVGLYTCYIYKSKGSTPESGDQRQQITDCVVGLFFSTVQTVFCQR